MSYFSYLSTRFLQEFGRFGSFSNFQKWVGYRYQNYIYPLRVGTWKTLKIFVTFYSKSKWEGICGFFCHCDQEQSLFLAMMRKRVSHSHKMSLKGILTGWQKTKIWRSWNTFRMTETLALNPPNPLSQGGTPNNRNHQNSMPPLVGTPQKRGIRAWKLDDFVPQIRVNRLSQEEIQELRALKTLNTTTLRTLETL